jgi:hypothetical protein
MRKFTGFLLGLSLLLGTALVAAAQEKPPDTMGPPKVLVVSREFLKPGRSGAVHAKAESAFVQAFTRAKWPVHYLAMESMSGKPRTLFLGGYDSFDAWEKDNLAIQNDAALSAALDHASAGDGDLQSDRDQSVFVFREDYSQHANTDIAHMRYFEIEAFHVRPGREKEWDEAVKMVKAGYAKGVPDTQWAMYELIYGSPGGTYLVITPRKSAAEIDHAFAEGPKFEAAMGEKGMRRLSELSVASIESSETNLFAFNPRMSYARDEWVKADPDFWKPKPAASSASKKSTEKKPAEKPTANQ